MSEKNYLVRNAADGAEIAVVIGSIFVNSFTYPTKKFYECMLDCDKDVQHNFTALCLEWFRSLADTNLVDGRNEASVCVAGLIAKEIRDEDLVNHKLAKKDLPTEYNFNYWSDEDAVRLIERYMRLSENNRAFINKMLCYVHKTSQQCFSRMCLNWLKTASSLPNNSHYVLLARKANKHYRRLPLV